MFNGKLRWFIMAWLFIITCLSYMDRANLSVAVPLIMKDFDLNAAQIGVIISGLTIGYTILNFPGGFLADYFSPKKVLITALVCWSIFTIFTGMAWSFASLLVIRIIFGAAEGPLGPSNTKIVSNWMPPRERGVASGLWLSAMTMGVVLGAPISGLIVQNLGWRTVFFYFGIAGLVLALITAFVLTAKPEEHRWMSNEELDMIKEQIAAQGKQEADTAKKMTLGEVFSSPYLWVISFIYFGLTALYWANLGWLPTYFVKARGSSIVSSGFLSALPYLCASLGPVVIGAVSDRLLKGWRTPLLITVSLVTVPSVFFAVNASDMGVSLLGFCIAGFCDFAAIGLMWTLPMELFPRERVAVTSGFMLMWGSAAGILSPILMGILFQKTGSFNTAYYVFALAALFSAALAVPLYFREKRKRLTIVPAAGAVQTTQ